MPWFGLYYLKHDAGINAPLQLQVSAAFIIVSTIDPPFLLDLAVCRHKSNV
jgi:hypothetical protein